MKEITRIHLAQVPYNIELAAKKDLEKYLTAIEKLLGTDADTLREIEARMGELLGERGVTAEKVITVRDVAELKTRLGEPGEFADEPNLATETKKRFMRDSRRGMLGGVLAGLAAYTNVDVVWYRIAAIILALMSFGTAVLLYVVLWVVVPPARTAAERLQMRGDEPNLENIQEEATASGTERPTRRKPFIILIRVFGVVSFVGAAIGALALVAFVLGVSIPMIGTYDWLVNGWLVGALIGMALSGVLFAVLMSIAGYGVGAWRMNKSMGITLIIVTAAGLTSFGTSMGLGLYGGQQFQTTVESHTKAVRTPAEQLKGAKELQVKNTGASWLSVRYVVTTGEPYTEARILQQNGGSSVPVTLERDGDTVKVQVPQQNDTTMNACHGLWNCNLGVRELTIYGPAIDVVRVSEGTLQYETKQSSLRAEVAEHASLTVEGTVTSLESVVASNANMIANSAAIDHVNLTVEQGSTVQFGTVQSIAITVPASCGADTENHLTYTQAQDVTVNGTAWHGAEAQQLTCVSIDREYDDKATPSMVY
jgi:phage shock protein PspC (stress-responsive transcriptional regulator)